MERQQVESTSLRSIGYDLEQEILEVEFVSGKVYRYQGVPGDTYREFLNAGSLGQFFNENIRDQYPFTQVE